MFIPKHPASVVVGVFLVVVVNYWQMILNIFLTVHFWSIPTLDYHYVRLGTTNAMGFCSLSISHKFIHTHTHTHTQTHTHILHTFIQHSKYFSVCYHSKNHLSLFCLLFSNIPYWLNCFHWHWRCCWHQVYVANDTVTPKQICWELCHWCLMCSHWC